MPDNKLDIEQIKELIELVAKTGIGELVVEQGDTKIKIAAKKPPAQTVISGGPAPVAPAVSGQEYSSSDSGTVKEGCKQVKSPIVGTFYSSPSPESEPYVTVGQKVKKGDVLFIVESMKLMNEVQSDFDGVVEEILCSDGQTVEFGQPVIILK